MSVIIVLIIKLLNYVPFGICKMLAKENVQVWNNYGKLMPKNN